MANRRAFTLGLLGASEEDARPIGALRFADPSKAEFPRHINTFNEPHSNSSIGVQRGIRSVTGDLVPWGDRHTADSWAAMNRKRGTPESEDE